MQKIYNLQDLNFINKQKNLKIGVLGGTFNPAHKGHLLISKRALEKYKFNFIIWLVAMQNPLKNKNEKNIFERAKSAINIVDDERILISTIEYDFNTQYTYDSISSLIKNFPHTKFTWLMGIDNVSNFPQWYRSCDIPKLCDIIIFDRLCSTRNINIADFGLKPSISLDNKKVNYIMLDNNPLYDFSSTKIRQNLEEQKS